MNPEIIIDGHNLLYRVSDLRSVMNRNREEARNLLIHKLNLLKSKKQVKISLVFDGDRVGQPGKQQVGTINVIYSVKPQTADEVIKLILQQHQNPASILVVSSDNSVYQFAKTSKAQAMRSEEFYKKHFGEKEIEDETRSETEMSRKDLAEWMKLFGATDKNER